MLDTLHFVSTTDEFTGLTTHEARSRFVAHGPNELESSRPRSAWRIALRVTGEPMILLLLASGGVYLLLGDRYEAIGLLSAIFLVIGITLFQEQRSERALEALRDLSSPRALVIRDGQRIRIPGREVVPGDVIVLNEGDRVPADAVLLAALNLTIDESLITGESVPVEKVADKGLRAASDQTWSLVHSGTLVVAGQGTARVEATGARTRLGAIGRALADPDTRRSMLQEETGRIVRIFAVVGLSACVVVVVAYGLTRGHWLNGVLAGLTMAISVLPEEMPVVLTLFLALGAWRIARRQVLTRRVPAIEALGSASVLCVDKTGTLTMNQMAVAMMWSEGRAFELEEEKGPPLPEAMHGLLEYSILASRKDAFDPMEKAFAALGDRQLGSTEHLHPQWELVREYPLRREMRAVANVWRVRTGEPLVAAVKGAPEDVLTLCRLESGARARVLAQADTMAGRGLRILAVGGARLDSRLAIPDRVEEAAFEFHGLVGLADPVRPGVLGSVQECQSAGIRVVMITGDYASTARNIAQQVGIASVDSIVTGAEIDASGDDVLRQYIEGSDVFARVIPEQKLRLVEAFKRAGHVVAMTGDGVNDAPALRAADIGIAMGGRGTDVAREAADLVLVNDDLTSIANAVRLGRRIYNNLTHAMAYIFAIHVPIVAVSLIPVFLKWPLVLMPLHIVCLEMVIDPACSIVFEAEPEHADVMRQPPRPVKQRLFGRALILFGLAEGIVLTAIVLAVYLVSTMRGQGEEDARALTYTTLVLGNLALILSNRSRERLTLRTLRTPNRALWWVVGAAVGFLAITLYVPAVRRLFRFSFLHPLDLVICAAAAAVGMVGFEISKRIWRQTFEN
jgi:Ca2+-transporting ATPase